MPTKSLGDKAMDRLQWNREGTGLPPATAPLLRTMATLITGAATL